MTTTADTTERLSNPALRGVITRWLKALRSGEYKQARGYLRRIRLRKTGEEKQWDHCCLGVLCDLMEEDKQAEWRGESTFHYGNSGSRKWLPDHFMAHLGMRRTSAQRLTVMNDGNSTTRRRTFEEIADYIEKNIEDMFPQLGKH